MTSLRYGHRQCERGAIVYGCELLQQAGTEGRKEGSLQIGGNQIKEFVSSKFEEQNNLKRKKSLRERPNRKIKN